MAWRSAEKSGIGDNALLFPIDPKGSLPWSYHKQFSQHSAFDNPAELHWSQAGYAPKSEVKTDCNWRRSWRMTPGIWYSFWHNAFSSRGSNPCRQSLNQGLYCHGQRLRPLGCCAHSIVAWTSMAGPWNDYNCDMKLHRTLVTSIFTDGR